LGEWSLDRQFEPLVFGLSREMDEGTPQSLGLAKVEDQRSQEELADLDLVESRAFLDHRRAEDELGSKKAMNARVVLLLQEEDSSFAGQRGQQAFVPSLPLGVRARAHEAPWQAEDGEPAPDQDRSAGGGKSEAGGQGRQGISWNCEARDLAEGAFYLRLLP
jgi:hypothetical protein